jgi:transposase
VEKAQWKILADRVEELCIGQKSLFELPLALEKQAQQIAKRLIHQQATLQASPCQKSADTRETAIDYQTVDLNSVEHHDVRRIGNEHVGFHAAEQLQLETILAQQGFNTKQVKIALASIIARLIQPGSVSSTHRYLTSQSALDEVLGTDFSTLSLKRLYQVSDQLLKHRTAIEASLYQREKDLFGLEDVVTLYDLTNTYFEGQCAGHSDAKRGRSKEKRYDRPLVTLGVVLDGAGFIKKSHIFAGNVSEAGTLEQMLSTLNATAQATVIMDAGISTEANLAWLRENKYHYIVVSRKKQKTFPEDAESVIVKAAPQNVVKACLVKNEETGEHELYCHSQAKAAKSQEMKSQAASRYEDALTKLSEGLTKKGCTKGYVKVLEKIGRLKEKYSAVAQHYHVTVTPDDTQQRVVTLTWTSTALQAGNGTYCLRTNRADLDEKSLWQTYTMLTDVEDAFRCLKTELGLRPVYHQKQTRIDGHLFISILAYHLLHTLRYQLRAKGISARWETLREILSTHCRLTTRLTLEKGRVVHIRKTASPHPEQAAIYQALGICTHPLTTQKTYL